MNVKPFFLSLLLAGAALDAGAQTDQKEVAEVARVVSYYLGGASNRGVRQNRTTRIDAIQVYGNAAQAKLTIEYPTFYFHDMMSLLKTEHGWKIVSKIFYREEKPARTK